MTVVVVSTTLVGGVLSAGLGMSMSSPLGDLLFPVLWVLAQWWGARTLLPAALAVGLVRLLGGATLPELGSSLLLILGELSLSLALGRQAWPCLWISPRQGIAFVAQSLLAPWAAGAALLLLLTPGDPALTSLTASLLGGTLLGLPVLILISPLLHALQLIPSSPTLSAPVVGPPSIQRWLEGLLTLLALGLTHGLLSPRPIGAWGLLLGAVALRGGLQSAALTTAAIAGLVLLTTGGAPDPLEGMAWSVLGLLGLSVGQIATLQGQDRTLRRHLERRLHSTEERLRAISSGLPDLTFLIDGADRTIEVFARQPDLLLFPPGRLQGRNLIALLPADLQPLLREQIRLTRLHNTPQAIEYPLSLPSGKRRWFEARFTPAGAIGGLGEAILIVARDITTERQHQRWQDQNSRLEALGRLAGGVAHDLNNSLQLIFISASFVQESLPPQAPQQTDLHDMLSAARRAQDLTRHLLTFSRREQLTPPAIDLYAALCTAVRWHLRTAPRLTIHLNADDPLATAHIEASSLERIFGNLAANARDAMGGAGIIDVTLRNRVFPEPSPDFPGLPEGAYVCLELHDQGPGLTPTDLEHLFEPFYTTKPVHKGSGLGLATVYALVRQVGGSIHARNHPQGGAIFTVHLPRAAGPLHPLGDRYPLLPLPSHILFVEDNESARRPLLRALDEHGYTVDVASDGREALDLFLAHPHKYDALITDITMPYMTGTELIAAVHAQNPSLPTLVITGYADVTFPPPVRVLHKPFDATVLIETLAELLPASPHTPP